MTRDPLKSPPWTAEEVQQLRELAATGASAKAIALRLRRSAEAVRVKAKIEGIALARRKSE